ncbi:unnamed protein product [Peniophora sp. CBMAI 1063]|nr:unnamed protein product [Peniophora sp. CBMAI 1063]
MDLSARLPAETLLGIFRTVQDIFPIPSAIDISSSFGGHHTWVTQAERTLFLLAWISLTHVCARWRNSALRDAGLWTDVPVVLGVKWMREFLNRSGDMGISIDWKAWRTQKLPGLVPFNVMETLIFPHHYKRLRNFEAQLVADGSLFPMLSGPWPALENLSVELTGDFPQYVLLGDDAPCLRHLSFHLASDTAGCKTFPWRAPFLRTLVVLDIYFYEGITAASMNEFLDALDAMPNLVHLRLGNGISSTQDSGHSCPSCSPPALVTSTKLRTLAFRGSWSMIRHLMEHIRPLPSSRLSVVVQNEDDFTPADLRSIYARLAAYSKRDPVLYHGFGAVEVKRNIATIRAFRSSDTLTSTSWMHRIPPGWHEGIVGTLPDLDIQLPWRDSSASTLLSLMKDLTPTGLRLLSLGIPAADVSLVLHKNIVTTVLRDVHILQLTGIRSASHFLTVDADAEVPTFFPALRLVEIPDITLWELLGLSDSRTVQPLADTLDARREAGFALPAVYLRIKDAVRWLRETTSLRTPGTAEGILQEVERLEAMSGVHLIGEEEEIMYDLAL